MTTEDIVAVRFVRTTEGIIPIFHVKTAAGKLRLSAGFFKEGKTYSDRAIREYAEAYRSIEVEATCTINGAPVSGEEIYNLIAHGMSNAMTLEAMDFHFDMGIIGTIFSLNVESGETETVESTRPLLDKNVANWLRSARAKCDILAGQNEQERVFSIKFSLCKLSDSPILHWEDAYPVIAKIGKKYVSSVGFDGITLSDVPNEALEFVSENDALLSLGSCSVTPRLVSANTKWSHIADKRFALRIVAVSEKPYEQYIGQYIARLSDGKILSVRDLKTVKRLFATETEALLWRRLKLSVIWPWVTSVEVVAKDF